ncbi:MAG: polysaccharide biosynthesis tyrosine autokinase [Acidimicrobiales bacterium]
MPAVAIDNEPGLRDYLRILRRRKGVIIICAVVTVGFALLAAFLQTPVYQGTAEVLLQQRANESPFNPNTGQPADPVRAMQTQIRVLESEPVRSQVRQRLGSAPPVSAQPAGQTDVVEVSAQNTVPKKAADIANAYANAYIDFRRKQAVDDTLAAAQQVKAKIDDLQNQVDGLDAQVNKAPPPQQAAVRQSLAAQKDALVTQQSLFKTNLDQLQVDAALKSGGAQLVSLASVPKSPVAPKPVRTAVIALGLGLVLGVSLAFLIDYLDDSVKTKDDLARVAPSIPVLGLIPVVVGWKDTEVPQVVSVDDPRAPASEAYRTVRTSIQFLALDRPLRTLQVTSANVQEGKTTTLVNLGVALARAGQRVVIACCDLRRPRVHEFFGLENVTGFTSVLLGQVPLTAALQPVPGQARLSLLASGPLPPNPSELLSSRRTAEVLTSLLQAEADIVLVDSPPVLPVTDALVISGRVDATLLVAVAGATTRKDAARAVELLQQVDAPLVGSILNGVTSDDAYGYYTRYEATPKATNGSGTDVDDTEPAPAKKT